MLLKLYGKNDRSADLQQVADLLDDSGIIICPTDTMYAFCCHAMKERAVERICRLKGIDSKKSNLSIVCYDISGISRYAKVDNTVFKLMKRNLPGPFTFILQGSSRLPKIFRNRKEIGVRMPSNPIIQEITRLIGSPLMVSTLPLDESEDNAYVTDPELIDEKWGRTVDLVIDGGTGGLEGSTVVDCTTPSIEIIRQGPGILED